MLTLVICRRQSRQSYARQVDFLGRQPAPAADARLTQGQQGPQDQRAKTGPAASSATGGATGSSQDNMAKMLAGVAADPDVDTVDAFLDEEMIT